MNTSSPIRFQGFSVFLIMQHKIRHQYSNCCKILVRILYLPLLCYLFPLIFFSELKLSLVLQLRISTLLFFHYFSDFFFAVSFNNFLFHLSPKISTLQGQSSIFALNLLFMRKKNHLFLFALCLFVSGILKLKFLCVPGFVLIFPTAYQTSSYEQSTVNISVMFLIYKTCISCCPVLVNDTPYCHLAQLETLSQP